ncbi:hypothetical protein ACWGCI_28790 [Streptomyces sp. NPDC054949]|uniref:hypothetical protein n=1 Tax=Streptomyces sp. WM4235 TaxID=1415551 RepID=UPI0006B051A2|nr:hypothetical protein [Streptomyces sp. WM4235]KOU42051.1 hypothetical protein ADK55_26695 [Streptomyces sp. WM4235]
MDPVGLACVVLPVTALLYGLLGVRIRQEGVRIRQEQVSHRGNRSLTAAEAEPLPGTGRRLPDAPFAAVVWPD